MSFHRACCCGGGTCLDPSFVWPDTVTLTLANHFTCESCIPRLVQCDPSATPPEIYDSAKKWTIVSGSVNGAHSLSLVSDNGSSADYEAQVVRLNIKTWYTGTDCGGVADESYGCDLWIFLTLSCDDGVLRARFSWGFKSAFCFAFPDLMDSFNDGLLTGYIEGVVYQDAIYNSADLECRAQLCADGAGIGYLSDITTWRGGTVRWDS